MSVYTDREFILLPCKTGCIALSSDHHMLYDDKWEKVKQQRSSLHQPVPSLLIMCQLTALRLN